MADNMPTAFKIPNAIIFEVIIVFLYKNIKKDSLYLASLYNN